MKRKNYQTLESHGFKIKEKVIEWPGNLFSCIKLGDEIGGEVGVVFLSKNEKNKLLFIGFDNKGSNQKPEKIDEVVVFIGKYYRVFSISKMDKDGDSWQISHGNEGIILNWKQLVKNLEDTKKIAEKEGKIEKDFDELYLTFIGMRKIEDHAELTEAHVVLN